MVLTDTHTHLYLDEFSDDLDKVVNRAFEKKVTRLFLPSICHKHFKSMLNLKNKFPNNIFLMSGLHPCYVNENYEFELDQVKMYIDENDIVAVGEIGIDLHWKKDNLDLQINIFEKQIDIANKYNLPVVIHCRESLTEILKVLKNKKVNCGGVFHCFTGTLEDAKQIIDLGFKLGIGGVVTFKNGKIDKFLNQIDIKNIVLETDSPYLAPTPHRGKRNESSFTDLICKKISEIYQLSYTEVAQITTQNSIEIFKI